MKKSKILMPLATAALLFSLAACNSNENSNKGSGSSGGGQGGQASLVATLHFEDAEHFSADGWWATSSAGPGATPYVEKEEASDGKCIGYFDEGDKETLEFTSDKAGKAELIATMYYSSSVDLYEVEEVTLNGKEINIEEAVYEPDEEDESLFVDVSLGQVDLIAGKNKLEISFLGRAPYLDDLKIMSKDQLAITVNKAPEKDTIVPAQTAMDAFIDTETQITLTKPTSLEGVSFASSKEDVASVSNDGKITGLKLGTATITISKTGWYSARIEVTVDKAGLPGEIRVQAEDAADIPSGFHSYTDRTSGIQNGHYGGAYITGYDVTEECSLSYTFESPKAQTMTLIVAGAPHYQMDEPFVFANDCTIKLNDAEVTPKAGAQIEPGSTMGAATVEIEIGDVNVKAGTNTFVIDFHGKAPALDAFRFIPKA